MGKITMNMRTARDLPNFRQDVEIILANVTDREEFLKVKEEWHTTKTIVDFIARQLSAFPDSARGQEQYPILNLDELGEKERVLFPSVVRNLSRCGVISYSKPISNVVVTSRSAREVFAGKNIRIENRQMFEKYRKSVLSAYTLIQRKDRGFRNSQSKKWPSNFKVSVKDREIWINDILLSKPYSVKGNKYFFDHVYDHPDQKLTREKMPDLVKAAIGGKNFFKILNELGFKGEILKVFFPERGKSTLLFRKSMATKHLAKDGINIELLVQELRTLATVRSSPK